MDPGIGSAGTFYFHAGAVDSHQGLFDLMPHTTSCASTLPTLEVRTVVGQNELIFLLRHTVILEYHQDHAYGNSFC